MLKNCPFCQGTIKNISKGDDVLDMAEPLYPYTFICPGGLHSTTIYARTLKEAADIWNRRAEVDALTRENDGLNARLRAERVEAEEAIEALTREMDEARAVLRDILERIGRQGLNQALIDRARRIAEGGK
jgi:hypothetical protein